MCIVMQCCVLRDCIVWVILYVSLELCIRVVCVWASCFSCPGASVSPPLTPTGEYLMKMSFHVFIWNDYNKLWGDTTSASLKVIHHLLLDPQMDHSGHSNIQVRQGNMHHQGIRSPHRIKILNRPMPATSWPWSLWSLHTQLLLQFKNKTVWAIRLWWLPRKCKQIWQCICMSAEVWASSYP